jgi:hypothetical protein
MECIILNTLLNSDEYTINLMCKSSKVIREICILYKSVLSKKILKERISFLSPDNTINSTDVKNRFSSYPKMLINWNKWGRSREFKIDIQNSDSDSEEDIFINDLELANKVLDKENKVLKEKLLRGDIVAIEQKKFVFDGFKLENLYDEHTVRSTKAYYIIRSGLPETYLGIDEFNINFWENIIPLQDKPRSRISVPIKIHDIKFELISSSGVQDAKLYSFKKEEKQYFLIIISEQGTFPEINFEDVIYYQLDNHTVPNEEIILEYPEMYQFNIFDDNTLRYRFG